MEYLSLVHYNTPLCGHTIITLKSYYNVMKVTNGRQLYVPVMTSFIILVYVVTMVTTITPITGHKLAHQWFGNLSYYGVVDTPL